MLMAVEAEAALVPWDSRRASTAFLGAAARPACSKPAELEQLGRIMLLYAGQARGVDRGARAGQP